MIFAPFLLLPRWVLTGVCSALILYLTLVPRPLPDNDIQFWEHTDKIVHAIMFGALYVCACLDLWRGRRRPPLRAGALLGLAVVAAGGAVEVAQQCMGLGRGGDVADLAADAAGVALAALLMHFLRYKGDKVG